MKFLEKFISVRNSPDKKYKVFKFLFLKIKFKRYLYFISNTNTLLNKTNKKLHSIQHYLLRNSDYIYSFYSQDNNIKIYLPYFPVDYIQRTIVEEDGFYEQDLLQNNIAKYIPQNAVIFDIGANIGNHSLYWAIKHKASEIYAFEPIKDTFSILCKNIELNSLQNIIKAYNFGLSNKSSFAKISHYELTNIGGTSLEPVNEANNDNIELKSLDCLQFNVQKIDFMKIDVEGMEIYCLNGAKNTILKYKPVIFIESFKDKFPQVQQFMKEIGYILKEKLVNSNYIFVAKS